MSNEMPQTPESVALRLYQIITGEENRGAPRSRDYHLSTYAECLRATTGKYHLTIQSAATQTEIAARQVANLVRR